MRTVNQPAEIRRKAPLQSIRDASVTTGLSMCFLRSGCKDGTVPHVMAGGKYMINVPALYRILNVPVGVSQLMNDFPRIPDSLKSTGRFFVWRKMEKNGRMIKRPYSPIDGRSGRVNDPSTMGTYDDATRSLANPKQRYDGIGLVLTDDLIGIDLDDCITEDGTYSELAKSILERVSTYTEKSPSGRGLHLIGRTSNIIDTTEYHIRQPGIEVYAAGVTKRYLTMTGDSVTGNTAVEDISTALPWLMNTYLKRSKTAAEATEAPQVDDETDETTLALDVDTVMLRMQRSEKWEQIAALLAGENPSGDASADDLSLCNYLAFFSCRAPIVMDRIFRESERYREKWDELHGAQTYGELTIQRAIRDSREVWSADWQSGNMTNDPDVQSAKEWLVSTVDVLHNPRYSWDSIGASYLLADFLKPKARYCSDARQWFVYDGRRWVKDSENCRVYAITKKLALALNSLAGDIDDDSRRTAWRKTCAKLWDDKASRDKIVRDAQSEYPVSQTAFDRDPQLLNLENRTLDLNTGTLRDHDPDDLCTKIAPVDYEPSAVCPRWDAFVGEIFPQDTDTTDFIQRWLGCSLVGELPDEKLVFLHGKTTRNGKSTLMESVAAVFGDYAVAMNPETLCERRFSDSRAPTEDIARLKGARLVTCPEPKKTMRLDASLVKQLTGGDKLNARFLHENSFDFRSVAHITLNANKLPDVDDMTIFWSGRVLVVPFTRHFEEHEQDPGLKKRFSTEEAKSSILNWLLYGLQKYRERGLTPSAAMEQELRAYRSVSDKTGRFIESCLPEARSAKKIAVSEVYSRYSIWCDRNGCYPIERHKFSAELAERGVEISRGKPTGGSIPTTVVVGRELSLLDCDDFGDLMTAG